MNSTHEPRTEPRPHIWKIIIDVLTVVVLIVGLLFALDQAEKLKESINSANRSTILSMWSGISNKWLDIDKELVRQPKLKAYIYDSEPIPKSKDEYFEAWGIANMTLDLIDYANASYGYAVRQDPGVKEIIPIDQWYATFRQIFSHSPAICAVLNENPTSYDETTRRLAAENCPK